MQKTSTCLHAWKQQLPLNVKDVFKVQILRHANYVLCPRLSCPEQKYSSSINIWHKLFKYKMDEYNFTFVFAETKITEIWRCVTNLKKKKYEFLIHYFLVVINFTFKLFSFFHLNCAVLLKRNFCWQNKRWWRTNERTNKQIKCFRNKTRCCVKNI